MKRVNVAAIKDFLEQCGCRFTSISEPINSQSVVTLVCTCGTSFTQSLKQIEDTKPANHLSAAGAQINGGLTIQLTLHCPAEGLPERQIAIYEDFNRRLPR